LERVFDVIVVGAGPGGSSVAGLLSRAGASTLVLDKDHFPRDKVCGDGLTPRALYWLDILGCLDEVIDAAPSYITEADLYMDGQHVLTGSYPAIGAYPGFSIVIPRRILDHIMLRHAVRCGAMFHPGCTVRNIRWESDGVVVEGVSQDSPVSFKSQVVVGADGANSMVSRALGNRIMEGLTAISMRGYYEGVKVKGARIQVYFSESYFPGYGWLFADEDGLANVGVGLTVDSDFPARTSLRQVYDNFVNNDIKEALDAARASGKPRGGWTSFFLPKNQVADRALLIGDAANLGDPIRSDGMHMAMDSAHIAAPAILEALRKSDFSAASLGRYQIEWNQRNEVDWRIGELVLTAAKNSELRDFLLSGLKVVASLARTDTRFEQFIGGVFSGANQARSLMSPSAWLGTAALNPSVLLGVLSTEDSGAAALAKQALASARRVISSPLPTVGWGLEVLAKTVGLAECYTRNELRMEA
jgi:geranylgeranyl reductase family protein